MKNLFFILFIFVSTSLCYSQGSILSSTIGSNGTSKIINTNDNSYYVSQSIDQTSVIGTFSENGYTIRQGYQQAYNIELITLYNNLNAIVYPNPFSQSVAISFTETITEDIHITVTDISGRNLKSVNYTASQKINLPLEVFSSGIYFLKISSQNKYFITKLLKK